MKLILNKKYPNCKKLYETKNYVVGLTYEGNNIIFNKNDIFKYNGVKYKMVDRLNYIEYTSLYDNIVKYIKNIWEFIKIIKS